MVLIALLERKNYYLLVVWMGQVVSILMCGLADRDPRYLTLCG